MSLVADLLSAWRRRTDVVLVQVLQVEGSAPCAVGFYALVTQDGATQGNLGGGALEHQSLRYAYQRLAVSSELLHVQPVVLSAQLDQCCGGKVVLGYQRFALAHPSSALQDFMQALESGDRRWRFVTPWYSWRVQQACDIGVAYGLEEAQGVRLWQSGLSLREEQWRQALRSPNGEWCAHIHYEEPVAEWLICGAGHVASALLPLLAPLAWRIILLDQRPERLAQVASLGGGVACVSRLDEVAKLPPLALVMTPSHTLDFSLCRDLLEQGVFVALIGSSSKGQRFAHRLGAVLQGDWAKRFRCPIGKPSSHHKHPYAVALALAHEMIGLSDQYLQGGVQHK